jgi:hypothetical protein
MKHRYFVTHYKPVSGKVTLKPPFMVEAESAMEAVMKASGVTSYSSLTKRLQLPECSPAVRDNAHLQVDNAGLYGWIAHRVDAHEIIAALDAKRDELFDAKSFYPDRIVNDEHDRHGELRALAAKLCAAEATSHDVEMLWKGVRLWPQERFLREACISDQTWRRLLKRSPKQTPRPIVLWIEGCAEQHCFVNAGEAARWIAHRKTRKDLRSQAPEQ